MCSIDWPNLFRGTFLPRAACAANDRLFTIEFRQYLQEIQTQNITCTASCFGCVSLFVVRLFSFAFFLKKIIELFNQAPDRSNKTNTQNLFFFHRLERIVSRIYAVHDFDENIHNVYENNSMQLTGHANVPEALWFCLSSRTQSAIGSFAFW